MLGVGKMERTHKYKNLKRFLGKQNKHSQFSLNTFLSGRFCHKQKGWIRFKLSDELHKEIKSLFAGVVGDFNLNVSQCGLFDRLIINNRFKCEYVAGQDYPSELRYLRRLLK